MKLEKKNKIFFLPFRFRLINDFHCNFFCVDFLSTLKSRSLDSWSFRPACKLKTDLGLPFSKVAPKFDHSSRPSLPQTCAGFPNLSELNYFLFRKLILNISIFLDFGTACRNPELLQEKVEMEVCEMSEMEGQLKPLQGVTDLSYPTEKVLLAKSFFNNYVAFWEPFGTWIPLLLLRPLITFAHLWGKFFVPWNISLFNDGTWNIIL